MKQPLISPPCPASSVFCPSLPQACPAEIKRVTSMGGTVLWGRVQGCLAVSRAFGDKTLAPYVIADPFISVRPIDPTLDLFLYLVSDRVTDLVEDPMGCQVVMAAVAEAFDGRGESGQKGRRGAEVPLPEPS